MQVTVLGNNGTCPGKDGACSSYLLLIGAEKRVLIDAGNGSIAKLWHVCDPAKIDAIIISHLHFDHLADLFPLKYMLESRRHYGENIAAVPLYIPPVPVWMKEEIGGNRIFLINEIYDGLKEELFTGTITFIKVKHIIDSFAIRIENGGRVFTYSSDSGRCPQLIDAAGHADVFLCEATFLSEEPPDDHHMSAAEAAKAAGAAGASKLLLTHYNEPDRPEDYETVAKRIFLNTAATRILNTYKI